MMALRHKLNISVFLLIMVGTEHKTNLNTANNKNNTATLKI